MSEAINEMALRCYGYGPWEAPYGFIGLEAGMAETGDSLSLRYASSLVNQVMVHGVQSEFKPVGEAELVEDITQMVLYSLLADEEFFTNFFVAEALGDMLDYFHFAVA